jgi:hypothetical protein
MAGTDYPPDMIHRSPGRVTSRVDLGTGQANRRAVGSTGSPVRSTTAQSRSGRRHGFAKATPVPAQSAAGDGKTAGSEAGRYEMRRLCVRIGESSGGARPTPSPTGVIELLRSGH